MTKDEMLVHLPLIQGVINRMGNNSFVIKGWTVTLVAAIFALAATGTNQHFILVALIPIGVFWFLDSYYLKQENLYRELYKDVIADCTQVAAFGMETKKYNVKSIPKLMITISTGPFYSLLFMILIFVAWKTGVVNFDAMSFFSKIDIC